MSIWSLQGTPAQQAIVQSALDRTTFPFEVLQPKLQADTGRTVIPVEWQDLSRYSADLKTAKETGSHLHVHEAGDTGHPVERRERVLGLAWYSGRVTLDLTLQEDPVLAAEVFLSEGAHMIDFFWMTSAHRVAVWNALHDRPEDDTTVVTEEGHISHDHSWFDHGGYYSWVGEAWMGLFVKAYSDVPVTIAFDHPPTPQAVEETRRALTPYFGVDGSVVYHDSHGNIDPDYFWVSAPNGRRPCKVCKP